MSNNLPKNPAPKNPQPPAASKPTDPKAPAPPKGPPPPAAPPLTVPPLFRRIDWVSFLVTTLLVFIGYWWTLAPDLTLEDCGELATGSFYAGVPHPPGYPVWTIYSWLFTLLPISNIAYRVALSSSLTGVLVCLFRWIHAPHQRRYLYLAFFWFGICFNNHQSLLVIALGLEVAVVAVSPKMGRDFLLWNVVIYILGEIGKSMGMISMLSDNGPLLFIYRAVGWSSAVGWVILLAKTRIRGIELLRD